MNADHDRALRDFPVDCIIIILSRGSLLSSLVLLLVFTRTLRWLEKRSLLGASPFPPKALRNLRRWVGEGGRL